MFLIEASNGKKISGYTDREEENEIILKFGTDFRVKDNVLEHPKGSFHVHLVEIDDDGDDQQTTASSMKHLQTKTNRTSFVSTNPKFDVFLFTNFSFIITKSLQNEILLSI